MVIKMDTKDILSNSKRYHRMPYKWKKEHPGYHSCAVCKNRPIDFCTAPDSYRHLKHPTEWWKEGVTDEQVFNAQNTDEQNGSHDAENALKVFKYCQDCPGFSWSKTAPFYPNDNECFSE